MANGRRFIPLPTVFIEMDVRQEGYFGLVHFNRLRPEQAAPEQEVPVVRIRVLEMLAPVDPEAETPVPLLNLHDVIDRLLTRLAPLLSGARLFLSLGLNVGGHDVAYARKISRRHNAKPFS